MSVTKLKLGTRRSLLAWAQSSWVARELEKKHPGLSVELVGIETQGDKILDKPLSQIDGKEFFTAELDHALLRGEVDLTVHSMKDLSLDRPEGIVLAAAPQRELQHDIIIFHESVIDRLKTKKAIRIGTSSPRRLALTPEFLKKALPSFNSAVGATTPPVLEFVQIRGNVNTRLSRIHEAEVSEKKLDAVILAFAGLERLALDEKASLELWKLLEHTRLMILPLRECPTAPAQGALAIETLKSASNTFKIIQALHDEDTLLAVQEERAVLREWGGGCHQKLGASFVGHSLYIQGEKTNGDRVSEIRGSRSHDLSSYVRIEAKDLFDFIPHTPSNDEQVELKNSKQVFFAHSRAMEHLSPTLATAANLSQKRIWVSGAQSWFKLASQGLWIEGSLEGQGFESLSRFTQKKLLRFKSENWAFLTHKESAPTAKTVHISTYSHQLKAISPSILNATHLYWTSSLPFQAIWDSLKTPQSQAEFAQKTHACGAGKTAAILKSHGINPIIFME